MTYRYVCEKCGASRDLLRTEGNAPERVKITCQPCGNPYAVHRREG